MGIAKRHKRRLVFRDNSYYWWVKRDDDFAKPVLHIASEDKKLIVLYPPGQPEGQKYMVSIGREFKGRPMDGCWHRYRIPGGLWDGDKDDRKAAVEDFPVTPGFVVRILEWCLDEGEAEAVMWDGRDFWL